MRRRTWVQPDVRASVESVMEPVQNAEDAIDAKMEALEALAGPGISGSFRPALADLNYALRRIGRHLSEVKDDADHLRDAETDLSLTLTDALLDTVARFDKAHKPPPGWCANAAHVLTGGRQSYLHHPDADRHQHVTDSGGNCRHPACRYSTDHPEPF